MSDPRIGRIVVAGLHQAIEEELPTRTEFYEHWLGGSGLRGRPVGMAPMLAVLSFLRAEGEAYDRVVHRAGRLVAVWHVDRMAGWRRAMAAWMPGVIRTRLALRAVKRLTRETYSGSSGRSRVAGGRGTLTISASLFCDVRTPSQVPLCHFYAGMAEGLLEAYGVPSTTSIEACRAVDGSSCAVGIDLGRRAESMTDSASERQAFA